MMACVVHERCVSESCAREGRCLDLERSSRDLKVVAMPARYADQATPLELLEELLARVRAGLVDPEALVVVCAISPDGKDYQFETLSAGPQTLADTLFYLEVAKMRVLAQAAGQ